MAKESSLEQIAKILILIDGIVKLVNGVIGILNELSIAVFNNPIPDITGNNGIGLGAAGLGNLINLIIAIIIGVVYIGHFTGKFKMDSAMMNGIVFLILGMIFGGYLTIIGGILYIVASLS